MSFKSKVVIVTGSSGGIGAAIAKLFSKEGADVVIVGRNPEKLHNTAKQCEANGQTPLVVQADISKDEEAKKIITETINKYGKIDILVNNAGFLRNSTLTDGNILDYFDEMHKTNLRAAVNMVQMATPHLIATKGNVINISSVCGKKVHHPLYTAYCMLKAALDHFTRGSALELGKYGVRVNTVSPGPVKTDFFAEAGITARYEDIGVKTVLDRWSQPDEIADLVLFVASDRAKGVIGADYVLDNGFLLAN